MNSFCREAWKWQTAFGLRRLQQIEGQAFQGNRFATASFSVFGWINPQLQTDWHLIKNSCLVEEVAVSQGLFSETNEKSWVSHSLLPEHQSVDYLLKINNGGGFINEKQILNKIQKITNVSTAYSIDISQLKSKEHLIFN